MFTSEPFTYVKCSNSFTGIVGATPLRATVSDGALKQQLIRLVTNQRVQ